MLSVVAVDGTGSTFSSVVGTEVAEAMTDDEVVVKYAETAELLAATADDVLAVSEVALVDTAVEPPYDRPQPSRGLFPGSAVRFPVITSSMGDTTLQLVVESRTVTPGHWSIPESPVLQVSIIFCSVAWSQAARKSPCPEQPDRSPLARTKG